MCPYKCKPCLTEEEAMEMLEEADRRTYNGDDICQQCHKKSNRKANEKTFEKAGREFGVPQMDVATLERQIAELQQKLAKMGVKV
jgi:hypothetical protein